MALGGSPERQKFTAEFAEKYMKQWHSPKLDDILQERRFKLEQERKDLIVKTEQWLDEFSPEFGIDKAYIFGSVTRVGKFRQNSDVDVAVENINPEKYCLAISFLSTYLERDVDIIRLNDCHFSDRIRQTGILWKKTP
ncbi:nucleotidyltransferase domain-containing protein [Aphanizomenon sp. PH219]|nr:nucleotidyltransferase domain-containing protein [Aphanizomenon sp. 202]MDK2462619.1 nucleotidyltransferase domain-containing protein [Aphanizomenon sp. PH219]